MNLFAIRAEQRRAVQRKWKKQPYDAVIGNDVTGAIYDPVQTGYIWVRKLNGVNASGQMTYGEPHTVRGGAGTNYICTMDAPVRVVYDDHSGTWEIQRSSFDALVEGGVNPAVTGNANDPFRMAVNFLKGVPILLGSAIATLSTPTLKVRIGEIIYLDHTGTAHHFNAGTIDLTSSVPAAGLHRLALVWLEADETLAVSVSTAKSVALPMSITDVTECLNAPPSVGALPSTAFRLYGGQTTITEADNFFDARQWINPSLPFYASEILMDRVAGSTYSTVQQMNDIIHSTGYVSGGTITDNGDGTIDVAAGVGMIRATNSNVVSLKHFDWAQSLSVALTDASNNWIMVEWNSGSPQVAVQTTEPTEYQTEFSLALVYRQGTDLHINTGWRHTIGDHAGLMMRAMRETTPFAHASGAAFSETGTRQFYITEGKFWYGLTEITTPVGDFDGTTDTFNYYYRDGMGGWTEVSGQTAIDNTQYDDGDGGLGTLTANRYGAHWVFIGVDSDVHVLYGQGDYTLAQAQEATPPASIPPELAADSRLIGKIIIQKSASSFTSIESTLNAEFGLTGVTNHNDLAGLDGGMVNEYFHWTSADYTARVTTDNSVTLTNKVFPDVTITDAAETQRNVEWQTAGVTRWRLYTDDVAESGSNAGSNLILGRHADNGSGLGASLTFNRASGQIDIGTNVSVKSSEVAVNDNTADVDFRVESDNRTHALFVDGGTGDVGINQSNPVTTQHIYNPNESTTYTNFSQALTSAGIIITTDYTENAYTPGLFWNTQNDNATKPKAGIHIQETASGTYMLLGVSANYGTGITNNPLTLQPATPHALITGDLSITGSISKGSGTFDIDHPLKPSTHSLAHSFVEAPRGDLIYRGRIQLAAGQAVVSIDAASSMSTGTFAALTRNPQAWLQGLAPGLDYSISGGVLTITSTDTGSSAWVDWLVMAERNDPFWRDCVLTDDAGNLIVERPKKLGEKMRHATANGMLPRSNLKSVKELKTHGEQRVYTRAGGLRRVV